MPDPRRIAVFLPNWVGDVVMATPTLAALRARFPDAEIVHVGRPAAVATLDGTGVADGAIDTARTGGLWGLARTLRRRRPDLAVLMPNSFRAALAAWLGGARRRVGYARDGRGPLLTDRLRPPRDPAGRYRPVPMLDYYAGLLVPLDAMIDDRPMRLPVAAADREAADALLADAGVRPDRPLVMLNPGASFGTSKMWAPRRYAALADRLIDQREAQVIVNAAPAEKRVARWVADAMARPPAVSFAARDNTLGLLKALLARCELLVTNDTGARHVAAALGAGVVTVFGSTDPEWSRIDYPLERIVRADVECSPCQLKLCPLPGGPEYHRCMESVSPERVFAAAAELLDGPCRPGERRP